MQTLTLTANDRTETKVLEYLQENASNALAAKINAGKKTIKGALEYAKKEAQKMASGASCVCVDDETVFGWIVHYFEEDDISEVAAKNPSVKVAATVKQQKIKPDPKKAVSDDPQMTLFEELFK